MPFLGGAPLLRKILPLPLGSTIVETGG